MRYGGVAEIRRQGNYVSFILAHRQSRDKTKEARAVGQFEVNRPTTPHVTSFHGRRLQRYSDEACLKLAALSGSKPLASDKTEGKIYQLSR